MLTCSGLLVWCVETGGRRSCGMGAGRGGRGACTAWSPCSTTRESAHHNKRSCVTQRRPHVPHRRLNASKQKIINILKTKKHQKETKSLHRSAKKTSFFGVKGDTFHTAPHHYSFLPILPPSEVLPKLFYFVHDIYHRLCLILMDHLPTFCAVWGRCYHFCS